MVMEIHQQKRTRNVIDFYSPIFNSLRFVMFPKLVIIVPDNSFETRFALIVCEILQFAHPLRSDTLQQLEAQQDTYQGTTTGVVPSFLIQTALPQLIYCSLLDRLNPASTI
jgi:hypothetical protein